MITIFLSIVTIGVVSFFFLQTSLGTTANNETKKVKVTAHSARTQFDSKKELVQTATVGAIGDILIHDWVYEDAKTGSTYDFKPMLSPIKSYLQQPDFLIANQETILGGVDLGLSSYPTFNSPQEVGDAFIDAGVDFVTNANNHSLDKGEKGILTEIDYFNKVGLPYVGAFKDAQDQQTIRVMNINGIKAAILSYTYGTNGIPIPAGKDYLVNLIDQEKMKAEIARAKQMADVVIMGVHWGNEYQRMPSVAQKDLAQYLVNAGADIIIGHHPHVLQPMEWLKADDGREAFVFYSLGNFLSGQMHDYKDIGGLATITIKKTIKSTGVEIQLSDPSFIPTYVSNQELTDYRVVPLKDATAYGLPNAAEKNEEITNHMAQWLTK